MPYLVRPNGEPHAQRERAQHDDVRAHLPPCVQPHGAAEPERAQHDGAEGEEHGEGDAHHDAVRDDGAVDGRVVRVRHRDAVRCGVGLCGRGRELEEGWGVVLVGWRGCFGGMGLTKEEEEG